MTIRTVRQVRPAAAGDNILAGAQFADAFRVTSATSLQDARMAAELTFGRSPEWVRWLMRVRNLAVAPFGLKTPAAHGAPEAGAIGIFPVLSEAQDRLVAGLDDRHLDFRVVVDVAAGSDGRQDVTLTTLVLTHNRLGRFYLAAIMPFHRLIVRSMLGQLTAQVA